MFCGMIESKPQAKYVVAGFSPRSSFEKRCFLAKGGTRALARDYILDWGGRPKW